MQFPDNPDKFRTVGNPIAHAGFSAMVRMNIKAVTGACKLIDGCSLELCSTTGSVVSSGINMPQK